MKIFHNWEVGAERRGSAKTLNYFILCAIDSIGHYSKLDYDENLEYF